MTDKTYIVANKQQELDVLKRFEENGLFWGEGEKPTEWVPSKTAFGPCVFNFPYVLSSGSDGNIIWFVIEDLEDETVVYDGRKEEKMYKVTQEFMDKLIKWRDERYLNANDEDLNSFVNGNDIQNIPGVVYIWWRRIDNPIERNNRLIAIVQWLNGEDMFEVEAPHKFVVRNDTPDDGGDYWFVHVYKGMSTIDLYISKATKFDTREEAQEWANSHQVVIEIDAEGNEVE